MKFSCRQDIEAPAAFVFGALTDFSAWERGALRRGADVVRSDGLHDGGPSWMVKFAHRGKERAFAVRLTNLDQPKTLQFSGTGASLDGFATIDLLELALRRTRLTVTLDLRPRTIAARVVLQSLRLARTRLDRPFAHRVAQICTEIEARYNQSLRG